MFEKHGALIGFVTVIILDLAVIVAGYFHGNMHIEAVYKSLT